MAYGSFNFGSSSYGGRTGRITLFISKVLLFAKDQISFVARITLTAKDVFNFVGRASLTTNDLRNFITKNTMIIIDILGLAVAARIKAVAREIKVRFRIK